MKAILEFNLPDEITEFRNAVDAGKAFSLIADLDRAMRDKLKYGTCTASVVEEFEWLRADIRGEFPDIDER